MRIFALLLVLGLGGVGDLGAEAVGLSWPQAMEEADVIARVRVEDDLVVLSGFTRTRSADGTMVHSTDSKNPEAYRKLATVLVVEGFKGKQAGETITIRHTNGFVCPNIQYKKGAEYLVFLRKEPDSKAYVTMNFYAGQFLIEGDEVLNFYLWPGFKHPVDGRLAYERVAGFLREAVAKKGG